MLTTWKLWRVLKKPPETHPLYQRTVETKGHPIPWYTGLAELIGVLLFVPMIVFTSAVYSMGWVVGISSSIAKERRQGTYDLLALSPGGPLGINWAVCLGCLYRNQIYRSINTRDAWIARFVIISILLFTLSAPFLGSDASAGQMLVALVYVAAVIAIVYLDHIQSILLSSLTGMLTPTYTTEQFNAQLWAFSVFVGVQTASYVATLLVTFVIVPALLPEGAAAQIIAVVIGVSVFYGLREAVIGQMWRLLKERLNVDSAEVKEMLG